jgi:hypothetical protein
MASALSIHSEKGPPSGRCCLCDGGAGGGFRRACQRICSSTAVCRCFSYGVSWTAVLERVHPIHRWGAPLGA